MSAEAHQAELAKLSNRQELLKVPEVARLILHSLREVLSELDIGTIRHSIGTLALASVLMEKLQETLRNESGQLQATTADTQTEALATPESQNKILELWRLLSDYMEIFLLFILLHDYGKRHISDIVNSNVRFTDQDKSLAKKVLDELASKSTNLEVDNSNFNSLLTTILGTWSLSGVLSVLAKSDSTDAYSDPPTTSPIGLAQQTENELKERVTKLLKNYLTQSINSTSTIPALNNFPENTTPEMLNRAIQWILIQLHPGQGLLEIAPATIEALRSSQKISLEQKANIAAIMIGVIAGHHTSGGPSGYPPVEILANVVEKCLDFLGLDKTTEFRQRATDLMLFTAAFAQIIDVMQGRCFDIRPYNQNTRRPLPTELDFRSPKFYSGEPVELKQQINIFTLYEWIRQQVFSNIPANEQRLVIENYNSLMARLLSFQVNGGDTDSQQGLSQLDPGLRVNFFLK